MCPRSKAASPARVDLVTVTDGAIGYFAAGYSHPPGDRPGGAGRDRRRPRRPRRRTVPASPVSPPEAARMNTGAIRVMRDSTSLADIPSAGLRHHRAVPQRPVRLNPRPGPRPVPHPEGRVDRRQRRPPHRQLGHPRRRNRRRHPRRSRPLGESTPHPAPRRVPADHLLQPQRIDTRVQRDERRRARHRPRVPPLGRHPRRHQDAYPT